MSNSDGKVYICNSHQCGLLLKKVEKVQFAKLWLENEVVSQFSKLFSTLCTATQFSSAKKTGIDSQWEDLKRNIDLFVNNFTSEEYVVNNWMKTDDNENFDSFHEDLDAFYELLFPGVSIPLIKDDTDIIDAKRLDLLELEDFVLTSLKKHLAVNINEVRILNREIATNVRFLLALIKDNTVTLDSRPLQKICSSCLSKDELLGEGTFGIVHRGHLRGVEVAIKSLKDASSNDCVELFNIKREAQILQAHQLPGVIRFFGVDDIENPTMIVMELSLCSLKDWLYKKDSELRCHMSPLHVRKKLRILYECAATFAFLCSVGVIHRDIKPANILITPGEHIKVADFGLTLARVDSTSEKNESSVFRIPSFSQENRVGSLPYMAPELLSPSDGGIYQYTEATDLYSFGIMMNEVMTEKEPHQGKSETQLMVEMLEPATTIRPEVWKPGRASTSLHTDGSSIFDDAHAVIVRCWDTKPTLRGTFKETRNVLKSDSLRQEVQNILNNVSNGSEKHVSSHKRVEDHLISNVDDVLMASHHKTGFYSGGLKGTRKHGQGEFTELNGCKYVGQYCDDYRQGRGTWYNAKGDSYEGNWSTDSLLGEVKITVKETNHQRHVVFDEKGGVKQQLNETTELDEELNVLIASLPTCDLDDMHSESLDTRQEEIDCIAVLCSVWPMCN